MPTEIFFEFNGKILSAHFRFSLSLYLLISIFCFSNTASWNYDFDSLTVPAKDTSMTISGLSSMTSYKFRVIAQNALGYSDPSEELAVTTLEEGKQCSNIRMMSI